MGYWIKKGSKCVGFCPLGEALFTPSQVRPPRKRNSNQGSPFRAAYPCDVDMPNPPKGGVIRNWNDFLGQASLLPDLSRSPTFALGPMESHFFAVADKHGIIDSVLDEEYY